VHDYFSPFRFNHTQFIFECVFVIVSSIWYVVGGWVVNGEWGRRRFYFHFFRIIKALHPQALAKGKQDREVERHEKSRGFACDVNY
jgi:hypothetical protein